MKKIGEMSNIDYQIKLIFQFFQIKFIHFNSEIIFSGILEYNQSFYDDYYLLLKL